MNMNLKEKNKVKITIKQLAKSPFDGEFPLAVMLQGEKGVTNYQLIDKFEINGKDREEEFEYEDVGTILCVHLKSYFGAGKPKKLEVTNVKVVIETEDGPKETELPNSVHKLISKAATSINLCGGGKKA